VRELKADGSLPVGARLRSSKYLNNLIAGPSAGEAAHRGDARFQGVQERGESRSPASSGCTGFGRDSSDCGVSAFKAELHPQSETRCFAPELCMA